MIRPVRIPVTRSAMAPLSKITRSSMVIQGVYTGKKGGNTGCPLEYYDTEVPAEQQRV
jgi:hypothetical protein